MLEQTLPWGLHSAFLQAEMRKRRTGGGKLPIRGAEIWPQKIAIGSSSPGQRGIIRIFARTEVRGHESPPAALVQSNALCRPPRDFPGRAWTWALRCMSGMAGRLASPGCLLTWQPAVGPAFCLFDAQRQIASPARPTADQDPRR